MKMADATDTAVQRKPAVLIIGGLGKDALRISVSNLDQNLKY